MDHAEVLFAPARDKLLDEHATQLGIARHRAIETHNAGALLPAEAKCYINHAKALTIAMAECLAKAHITFHEAAGREAIEALVNFHVQVVAARKASFAEQARLTAIRTGKSTSQLTFILREFGTKTSASLTEGRKLLDMQRVAMENGSMSRERVTKYVVDTCVFNWIADGRIKIEELPTDGGFAITHLQVDEINKTMDEDKRARLHLVPFDLHCKIIPTNTLVWGTSRLGRAKLGDGVIYTKIKIDLDLANGGESSNLQDALIAEAAIENNYTLITADGDLKVVSERHGATVIFFSVKKTTR